MNSTNEMIQYVGYDKTTGRIVHTHSRFSVAENRHVEIPMEELKARFSKDKWVVSRLSSQDPNNLDFIQIGSAEVQAATVPMMVDHAQRKLVPQPSLKVHSHKHVIAGDGKDSAEIEISVVDRHGKVIESSAGEIKVITGRGRLSARGGLVRLEQGRARLSLTSANETVDKVRVTAKSVSGAFVSGHLDFEFV
jgi:hypothetical protein